MKSIFLYCIAISVVVTFAPLAGAATVDFTYPFTGIDDDTSSWSTNDSMVTLGNSISILSGIGTVNGYSKQGSYYVATNLSHRGTRGLGVNPTNPNERDEINQYEGIVVSFTVPQYLNSFEVRSLFTNDAGWLGLEEGEMHGYLNGVLVLSEHMQGTEDFYVSGTKGILSYSYANPYLVNILTFKVLSDYSYSSSSEFALAKFDVTPIPEPASMALLGMGIAGLMAVYRRKK